MYNTEIYSMPAYTNREFVNFGLHENNELYSYKFTTNDLIVEDYKYGEQVDIPIAI